MARIPSTQRPVPPRGNMAAAISVPSATASSRRIGARLSRRITSHTATAVCWCCGRGARGCAWPGPARAIIRQRLRNRSIRYPFWHKCFFRQNHLRFNPHLSKSPPHHPKRGEVPEWSNGAVSKTVEPARVPWVRIPPSPPFWRFQPRWNPQKSLFGGLSFPCLRVFSNLPIRPVGH
jgi:hypothetical protein